MAGSGDGGGEDLKDMNWRKFIQEACAFNDVDPKTEPIFYPPALPEDLIGLQQSISFALPQTLQELLLQTNGVGERIVWNEQRISDLELVIFSLKAIKENTLASRSGEWRANLDIDEMCFIGSPYVDGIYFAIRKGEDSIYEWDPYVSEFSVVAPNFEIFVQEFLSKKLLF